MRIIHCADIHLDSALTTHLDKERARSRRKEILDTFRRMLFYASNNDVQAVIIAGDLFDSETVSAATVGIVLGEIKRHKDLNVYYLRGNHDPGSGIFAGRDIPENLYLFDDEWKYYLLNEEKDSRENIDTNTEEGSNIVLAGVVLTAGNSALIYDDLDLREDDINIVTLHGQEQEYGRNCGDDVCLGKLRDKGIDYLALGHIHKPKCERLDHRGIYAYSGCLEGRGFDECGDHGFVLLDIDEKDGTIKSEFVPFAYRRLYEVVVDITGVTDNQDAADMIAEQLYMDLNKREENMEKVLVKIIVTGELDVESEVDIDYLTRQFMDSFYYVNFVDRTRLKIDPLKYVHDATLRGEFVRLVMAQDMSDEDKAFVIQTGVRALAGEEVWSR